MSLAKHPTKYLETRYPVRKKAINWLFDALAFLIVAIGLVVMIWGGQKVQLPTAAPENQVNLDYANLMDYGLRTALRMFCALVISLIFSLIYATAAAKNKYCEQILIPLLDVLQSIPILGYISFTVTIFLTLCPGQMIGVEMAAIFAIFTSQVWNMIFSLYQSLTTVPKELKDVASMLQMNKWQQFWRLEIPYALPSLTWNIVLSMSGGWFFVIASEVITVGDHHLALPGIGAYISLALEQQNIPAILYGIVTMSAVILLYDQILIRPLVVWSDKFRYEMTADQTIPRSWVLSLFRQASFTKLFAIPIRLVCQAIVFCPIFAKNADADLMVRPSKRPKRSAYFDYLWYSFLSLVGIVMLYQLSRYFAAHLTLSEIGHTAKLTTITLIRIVVLVTIASIVWVPIGIYIGLNARLTAIAQPLIQFLAAFPINLFFPVLVITIVKFKLNPEIWLSLLMILGTQWFILFNVIAGASACPGEVKELVKNLRLKGVVWWSKVMLPAVLPHFLVGAITAFGTAWNTSIIAEVVSYGGTQMVATGIGSYITENTIQADFPRIVLGIAMMSLFVVVINRLFWKPLATFVNKKYNFNEK